VPRGPHTQAALLASAPEFLAQLKAATTPAEIKAFRNALLEHIRGTRINGELQDYLSQDEEADLLPAIGFLYFVLSSGYGQSRLVAKRLKPQQEHRDSAAA
jgi:hypothetical protein